MKLTDEIVEIVTGASGKPHRLQYLKRIINVVADAGARSVWLRPKQTLLHVGAYVADAEAWVKRFDEAGLASSLKRGNKAVLVKFTAQSFAQHKVLLQEFIRNAFSDQTGEAD